MTPSMTAPAPLDAPRRTHLQQLEDESIHIIREVVAQFERPVMLYSIGKDSGVMLRLAEKAFFPGKLPFPLLHVDTTWKFREMITHRDRMATELGVDLSTAKKFGPIVIDYVAHHGGEDLVEKMKAALKL